MALQNIYWDCYTEKRTATTTEEYESFDAIELRFYKENYGAFVENQNERNAIKGDQKMREKVEKDVKNFNSNKRLIQTTGVIVIMILLLSIYVGGSFHEFCEAAIPWVLMGIGVACSVTYLNQKE